MLQVSSFAKAQPSFWYQKNPVSVTLKDSLADEHCPFDSAGAAEGSSYTHHHDTEVHHTCQVVQRLGPVHRLKQSCKALLLSKKKKRILRGKRKLMRKQMKRMLSIALLSIAWQTGRLSVHAMPSEVTDTISWKDSSSARQVSGGETTTPAAPGTTTNADGSSIRNAAVTTAVVAGGAQVFRLQRTRRRQNEMTVPASWNASDCRSTILDDTNGERARVGVFISNNVTNFVDAQIDAKTFTSGITLESPKPQEQPLPEYDDDDYDDDDSKVFSLMDEQENTPIISDTVVADKDMGKLKAKEAATPVSKKRLKIFDSSQPEDETKVTAVIHSPEPTGLEQDTADVDDDKVEPVSTVGPPDGLDEETATQTETPSSFLKKSNTNNRNSNNTNNPLYPKERMPVWDPKKRAKIAAKYAAIDSLGDRAYQILKDLKMI